MKKLLIALGIVVLLVVVAGAGITYYVYRQVSSTLAQFAELGQVVDLEREVRNRTPFVPPRSLELTENQVEKFMQVQSAVRRRLGDRMAAFEAKYKSLAQKETASLRDATAILNAYRDLAATWLDAKRSQIDALNAAELSLDEYRWIRDQAYQALGQPFVDLDIAKLMDEVRRGVTSDAPGRLLGSIGPGGPEANRKRIERFKKMLEENLALATFGL
jgi:hypothetical protein